MTLDRNTRKILTDIKKNPPQKLDRIVQEIHDDVFSRTDCFSCAECCKRISPILYNHDIRRLASALKMDLTEFSQIYLTIDKDNDYVFKTTPCPFLGKDNRCMVYNDRPSACRDYPHTDRRRFFQLIDLSIKNADYCPAVKTILEKLGSSIEKELRFRKR